MTFRSENWLVPLSEMHRGAIEFLELALLFTENVIFFFFFFRNLHMYFMFIYFTI